MPMKQRSTEGVALLALLQTKKWLSAQEVLPEHRPSTAAAYMLSLYRRELVSRVRRDPDFGSAFVYQLTKAGANLARKWKARG